jgi:hypothetical protein
MTVAEIFREVNLEPHGPVRWSQEPDCDEAGVYVVARVGDSKAVGESCEFPFVNPSPEALKVDREYETQRWLKNEPIVYVGKTDQTVRKRIQAFCRHKCGNKSPHAGGQAILLLNCGLWVYWSPTPNPKQTEDKMLEAFEKRTGKRPYANFDRKRRPKRIALFHL